MLTFFSLVQARDFALKALGRHAAVGKGDHRLSCRSQCIRCPQTYLDPGHLSHHPILIIYLINMLPHLLFRLAVFLYIRATSVSHSKHYIPWHSSLSCSAIRRYPEYKLSGLRARQMGTSRRTDPAGRRSDYRSRYKRMYI